jgi:hypothetical protein
VTTNRTLIRRPSRGALTSEQELELWLGASHGSAFDSREHLQQVWARHRDKVMMLWAKDGKRPAGWWEFEAPFPRPPFGHEASALYEAGLLGESESTELVARWRREFERAQAADFSVCTGPDCILRGQAARAAHYRWCDIPGALLKDWQKRRRRRSKTIRKLETAATEQPAPVAG